MTMFFVIVDQILNIRSSKVACQTALLIYDFCLPHFISVVGYGLVKEPLVEHGLQEDFEVTHKPGGVAVFVLREDTQESVVFLILDVICWSNLGEVTVATECSED